MNTLGDLVARDRRTRDPALRAHRETASRYDYYQFCTAAQRTGNFFRHFGIGSGETVAIVAEPGGPPVLSLFGATLLGARARVDPSDGVDDRLLVAPASGIDAYEVGPSTRRVAYGDGETDPDVRGFGESVWSENPACPIPSDLGADDPALVAGGREYTHGTLLDAADRVVDERSLGAGDAVAVRAPLSRPRTVVAGVLAPLSVGATAVVSGDRAAAAIAVSDGDAPEPRVVDVDDVALDADP